MFPTLDHPPRRSTDGRRMVFPTVVAPGVQESGSIDGEVQNNGPSTATGPERWVGHTGWDPTITIKNIHWINKFHAVLNNSIFRKVGLQLLLVSPSLDNVPSGNTHTNLPTLPHLLCLFGCPFLLDNFGWKFGEWPSLKPVLQDCLPELLKVAILHVTGVWGKVLVKEGLLVWGLPQAAHVMWDNDMKKGGGIGEWPDCRGLDNVSYLSTFFVRPWPPQPQKLSSLPFHLSNANHVRGGRHLPTEWWDLCS